MRSLAHGRTPPRATIDRARASTGRSTIWPSTACAAGPARRAQDAGGPLELGRGRPEAGGRRLDLPRVEAELAAEPETAGPGGGLSVAASSWVATVTPSIGGGNPPTREARTSELRASSRASSVSSAPMSSAKSIDPKARRSTTAAGDRAGLVDAERRLDESHHADAVGQPLAQGLPGGRVLGLGHHHAAQTHRPVEGGEVRLVPRRAGPLTRTQPVPPPSSQDTTRSRAASFASGATASSRSRITSSAADRRRGRSGRGGCRARTAR